MLIAILAGGGPSDQTQTGRRAPAADSSHIPEYVGPRRLGIEQAGLESIGEAKGHGRSKNCTLTLTQSPKDRETYPRATTIERVRGSEDAKTGVHELEEARC